MSTWQYQCLAKFASLLFIAVGSVQSDGQIKEDHFNRQSCRMAYPASRVFESLPAHSSLQCGVLCANHESCQAHTYIEDSKACELVDQPQSDALLITQGRDASNSKTFKKASSQVEESSPSSGTATDMFTPAMCTDPDFTEEIGLQCNTGNHNGVVAYLSLDGPALLFLDDSTYVYCNEDAASDLIDHRGQSCEKPEPLSRIDPQNYFASGPPDAAVENGAHYLLFKGRGINVTPKCNM